MTANGWKLGLSVGLAGKMYQNCCVKENLDSKSSVKIFRFSIFWTKCQSFIFGQTSSSVLLICDWTDGHHRSLWSPTRLLPCCLSAGLVSLGSPSSRRTWVGTEWDHDCAATCGLRAIGLLSPGQLLTNCRGSGGGFVVGSGFVEGISFPSEKFPMVGPEPDGNDGHVAVGCV